MSQLCERMGEVSKGASKDIIDTLPVTKYEKKEEESQCNVCLDVFEQDQEVIRLPKCHHGFHKGCITKWLEINKICPVCRVDIIDK